MLGLNLMKSTNNLSINLKENRDIVLTYLRELEEINRGYYCTDLMLLAKKLGIKKSGLKKMLVKWLKEDSAFSSLHYLGRHKPSSTPNEFISAMADDTDFEKIAAIMDEREKAEKEADEEATIVVIIAWVLSFLVIYFLSRAQ